MNFQKRMLARIQEIVEAAGYDFERNGAWANTGSVYVRRKGSFHHVLAMSYDYQSGYFTHQWYPADTQVRHTCGFTHETCIRHSYIKTSDGAKCEAELVWLEERLKPMKTLSGKRRNLTLGDFRRITRDLPDAEPLYIGVCDDEFNRGGGIFIAAETVLPEDWKPGDGVQITGWVDIDGLDQGNDK